MSYALPYYSIMFYREMLGCIHALKDWRHYLEGITFEIITNHKNIEWWALMRDLNRQQARCTLYLSHFDFKITYLLQRRINASRCIKSFFQRTGIRQRG
jgi:hypothetical protein